MEVGVRSSAYSVALTRSITDDTVRTQATQCSRHTQFIVNTEANSLSQTAPTQLQPSMLEVPAQKLRISLLYFNVCGLKSKLFIDEFTDLIKCYDVICMCETKCDDVDMINVSTRMDEIGYDIV